MEELYNLIHPKYDDYLRLDQELRIPLRKDNQLSITESKIPFLEGYDISTWSTTFFDKVSQAEFSLINLLYIFEQGINDDEWLVKGKGTVRLLPHFEQKDYFLKFYFDYYVDNFFYKVSSALDVLSHISNRLYNWNMYKPSFKKCWDQKETESTVKLSNEQLYFALREIIEKPIYKDFRRIRNDFTHNHPPSSPTSGVIFYKDKERPVTSLGGEEYRITKSLSGDHIVYTSSGEIKKMVLEVWELLIDIIDVVNEHMR
ncbi:Cthe_2314 family HEPN domain-containing protein [Paenibacillus peoriae]|uniref:Cthe_2314 family HEPN domain-containing protein n=1 Tax=Paenibacillus peoriae TaxID=59893 RepID=UPI0032AF10DA